MRDDWAWLCAAQVIAVFDELGGSPVFAGPGPALQEGGYEELPVAPPSRSRRRIKSPRLLGMIWVVLAARE